MNLAPAPQQYDRADQQNTRLQILQSDLENWKKRQDIRFQSGERLILKAPDGGLWALSVNNAGTLTTVAV